jgi:ABC-2 type transport system permease protein
MLKGAQLHDVAPQIWPILLFTLAAGTIALLRYRQTLD